MEHTPRGDVIGNHLHVGGGIGDAGFLEERVEVHAVVVELKDDEATYHTDANGFCGDDVTGPDRIAMLDVGGVPVAGAPEREQDGEQDAAEDGIGFRWAEAHDDSPCRDGLLDVSAGSS